MGKCSRAKVGEIVGKCGDPLRHKEFRVHKARTRKQRKCKGNIKEISRITKGGRRKTMEVQRKYKGNINGTSRGTKGKRRETKGNQASTRGNKGGRSNYKGNIKEASRKLKGK